MNQKLREALISKDFTNLSPTFKRLYDLLDENGQRSFNKNLQKVTLTGSRSKEPIDYQGFALEDLCRSIPKERFEDAINMVRTLFDGQALYATSENCYLTPETRSLKAWSWIPGIYRAHADWSSNSELAIFESVADEAFVKSLVEKKVLLPIQDIIPVDDKNRICTLYDILIR